MDYVCLSRRHTPSLVAYKYLAAMDLYAACPAPHHAPFGRLCGVNKIMSLRDIHSDCPPIKVRARRRRGRIRVKKSNGRQLLEVGDWDFRFTICGFRHPKYLGIPLNDIAFRGMVRVCHDKNAAAEEFDFLGKVVCCRHDNKCDVHHSASDDRSGGISPRPDRDESQIETCVRTRHHGLASACL